MYVFVHGFLGNPLDLKLVRDHIFMVNPDMLSLLSACNQDRTYDDLQLQGERLAKEVVAHLHLWFAPQNSQQRKLRR